MSQISNALIIKNDLEIAITIDNLVFMGGQVYTVHRNTTSCHATNSTSCSGTWQCSQLLCEYNNEYPNNYNVLNPNIHKPCNVTMIDNDYQLLYKSITIGIYCELAVTILLIILIFLQYILLNYRVSFMRTLHYINFALYQLSKLFMIYLIITFMYYTRHVLAIIGDDRPPQSIQDSQLFSKIMMFIQTFLEMLCGLGIMRFCFGFISKNHHLYTQIQ
jgi:hypothetical protein